MHRFANRERNVTTNGWAFWLTWYYFIVCGFSQTSSQFIELIFWIKKILWRILSSGIWCCQARRIGRVSIDVEFNFGISRISRLNLMNVYSNVYIIWKKCNAFVTHQMIMGFGMEALWQSHLGQLDFQLNHNIIRLCVCSISRREVQ